MLDWLIIGGGVHGTYLSNLLTRQIRFGPDRVRVLDPYPTPLARWEECTANTGMPFLRSPVVHHLDLNPFSLHAFSQTPEGKPHARFTWPYDRPGLDFFRRHCRHTIQAHGLEALRLTGRATGLFESGGGIRVETDRGALRARRVVLAISLSEHPCWPDWALPLKRAGANLHHIFTPGFNRADLPAWNRVLVVGGGITAAQTALALTERQPGTVTLLARHEIREHQFDSDPGWIGPKYMDHFEREPNPANRRRMIKHARHRGSMPPEVAAALGVARDQGKLTFRVAEIAAAALSEQGAITVTLAQERSPLPFDCVVLATGFDPARPGGPWLDRTIERLGLPCAACGYPLVDRRLGWGRGIHVTGPLAELELGPTARNIIGARKAGERLLKAE